MQLVLSFQDLGHIQRSLVYLGLSESLAKLAKTVKHLKKAARPPVTGTVSAPGAMLPNCEIKVRRDTPIDRFN